MKPHRSIYGPLSVGFPVIGLGIGMASAQLLSREGSSWIALVFLASLLLGLASGIKGMMHPERMRWLPAIGFGFNLVLLGIGLTL